MPELDGDLGYRAARRDDEIVDAAVSRCMPELVPNGFVWERTLFGSDFDRAGIDGHAVKGTQRVSYSIRFQEIQSNERAWRSFTPRDKWPDGRPGEIDKFKTGAIKSDITLQAYVVKPFETGRLIIAGRVRTRDLISYVLSNMDSLTKRFAPNGVPFRVCFWRDMAKAGIDVRTTPLEHYCGKCGADAHYGYDVSLRLNIIGSWYCREHRPG